MRLKLVVAAVALSACTPEPFGTADIARIERQIEMPPGAAPLDTYARRYAPPRVFRRGEQLPFSTFGEASDRLEASGGEWVVALFLKPGIWGEDRAGARVVANLPYADHGGCWAVNMVFEPETGRTIAGWCNVDMSQVWPPPPD